uniref:probable RNA-binding protein 46 n=2 Tax=Myxine glutinosa TaxID=7769 RepID=UPI00358EF884
MQQQEEFGIVQHQSSCAEQHGVKILEVRVTEPDRVFIDEGLLGPGVIGGDDDVHDLTQRLDTCDSVTVSSRKRLLRSNRAWGMRLGLPAIATVQDQCRRCVDYQEAKESDEPEPESGAAGQAFERRESAASVGRHYGINESSIYYIRKEKVIHQSVSASAALSMKDIPQKDFGLFRCVFANTSRAFLSLSQQWAPAIEPPFIELATDGMARSPDLMSSPKMPLAQGTKNKTNTDALLDLMEKTGYNMIQENGQRRFGPPPDWIGPPPPRGCEVFVGKIPRDVFEDELVPVFERAGQIYEFRLMMEFSGENRGYAFVNYTNRKDSQSAIDTLNNYKLRPGHPLGVCISIDNCRIFIGGLPRDKGQEEVLEEMKMVTDGVKDVVVYPGIGMAAADRNRGFAFVQYESHRSAAMARRKLRSGSFHSWGHPLKVDWANPEREMDPEVSCVRTLNVKNLSPATSERMLRSALQKALCNGPGGNRAHTGAIEKIKKTGNFAVVHFKRQEDALRAQNSLHGAQIDGAQVLFVFEVPYI